MTDSLPLSLPSPLSPPPSLPIMMKAKYIIDHYFPHLARGAFMSWLLLANSSACSPTRRLPWKPNRLANFISFGGISDIMTFMRP